MSNISWFSWEKNGLHHMLYWYVPIRLFQEVCPSKSSSPSPPPSPSPSSSSSSSRTPPSGAPSYPISHDSKQRGGWIAIWEWSWEWSGMCNTNNSINDDIPIICDILLQFSSKNGGTNGNPFFLLLNSLLILKTSVHLQFLKISDWPIWFLIDPL